MSVRVGINGFGRIGRSVYRIAAQRDDMTITAINDITPNETLAYLTKFDTVMGEFPGELSLNGNILRAGNMETQMHTERDPAQIPWGKMDVDVVVESTGVFRDRKSVEKHIQAGAKKVVLTVPAKDELDAMIVFGVNEEILKADDKIVSNASCTTNCLGPIAKLLHENFEIERGFMTTVHAYTNDQRLSDFYHKDLRRARAANENIIPTTTGAAKAVGKVYPPLSGRLDGMSMRVPIPDGSTIDLVVKLTKSVTANEINGMMKEAAQGKLKGILQYSTDPIVSSDILGNSHSSIFDSAFTRVLRGDLVKVVSWYDNEWGYSNRVADLVAQICKF